MSSLELGFDLQQQINKGFQLQRQKLYKQVGLIPQIQTKQYQVQIIQTKTLQYSFQLNFKRSVFINSNHTAKTHLYDTINPNRILLSSKSSGNIVGTVFSVDQEDIKVDDGSGRYMLKCQKGLFWEGKIIHCQIEVFSGKYHLIKQLCQVEKKQPLRMSESQCQNFRIIIASGPYTTYNNIDYLYLQKLLLEIKKVQAQVVILMGPFLEFNNQILSKGIIKNQNTNKALTYNQLFQNIISYLIQNKLKANTHIYFQPSTHDIHHPFPIPQKSYFQTKSQILKNKKYLTNPVVLKSKNQVTLSIINFDIVSEIQKNHKALKISNLKKSICQQISNQKLIIPQINGLIYMPHKIQYQYSPNIIIISSNDLNPFIQNGQTNKQTTVINVGKLIRQDIGNLGMSQYGYFCEMIISNNKTQINLKKIIY